jgi:peptidoglycan DL-endopeptidase CwlO
VARFPHLPRFVLTLRLIGAVAVSSFVAHGVAATAKKKPRPTAAAESEKREARSTPRSSPKPASKSADTATPAPSPAKKTSSSSSTATPRPLSSSAPTPTPAPKSKFGPNVSLQPDELVEYAQLAPEVQSLIRSAMELTKLNLTYTYGSAEPANGGMDCSGTIYHLLRSAGFAEVPRDSAGQYVWTRRAGEFRAVVSRSEKSFEFNELRPGDLLFWSGTYSVEREFPITHVMLYLGTERKTKQRVMFGASDGRTYAGVPRWGVSVFDFRMPRVDSAASGRSRAVFVGYGVIPGLRAMHRAPELIADQPSPKATDADPDEEASDRPRTRDSGENEQKKSKKPTPATSAKKKKSAGAKKSSSE